MSNSKISALTSATTPLAGTETLPIVQSGTTTKVTVANLTAGRAFSATQLTLTTGNLIVANGQGVDFSATPGTGTSELFADYEEGTWTPTARTNCTVNSVNSAFYTKVGRIVNAYAYFNVTTTSASITISGLPFNCTGFGPANVYFTGGTLLPFTGSSYVEASAAYVNLNVGSIGTAAIMVSVSYMV